MVIAVDVSGSCLVGCLVHPWEMMRWKDLLLSKERHSIRKRTKVVDWITRSDSKVGWREMTLNAVPVIFSHYFYYSSCYYSAVKLLMMTVVASKPPH